MLLGTAGPGVAGTTSAGLGAADGADGRTVTDRLVDRGTCGSSGDGAVTVPGTLAGTTAFI